MTRRAVCTCVLTLVCAGALAGWQQAAFAVQASAPKAPWYGTWQLVQPAPAGRFDAPPYKKVTLRIEPWEERRPGVPGDREERRPGVPGDREERRPGVP